MAAPLSSRQNHSYSSNLANTKQAQLANAYQQLARELASDQIKVVGGYTLGKVIGEGTFGSVHIATHRVTGTRCAIKKVPKSATPQLTREIHHHRNLHHPNIVHLHEIIATESHIWLVSELCSGGELFDYLVERGRILEGEARRLFGELCTAVGWLHRHGVVHRDLKLENVLLDGELRVKLGDLGFAREYAKGRLMDTFCGTTGYASPEMLECKKYQGVETDIWSLGIILYTLLCGGLPFDHDDERVMKDLIIKGEYDEPDWLSEEARSLIRGMLKRDPSERLTMEGILTHPWFKKTLYDNIQGATSTDHPQSIPPSPLISSFSNEPRAMASSTSVASFPFSPRGSRSQVHLIPEQVATQIVPEQAVVVQSPEADSEPSETSFDFDPLRPASGDTSPTTAENEDESLDLKRPNSAELSLTEQSLELLHPNSSQSTIRKSDNTLRGRIAKRLSLESQREEDETQVTPRGDKRLSSSSLPAIDENALPLPVADHSRTPVRTKRRSLTSQLPLERRLSHHSTSSQWQVFPPEDYLDLLNAERPPLFSTPSEKRLLHRMSDLGFDTGQLIHSVMNDACDCAAAIWWILRLKQLERGESDDVVRARALSNARRRERAAARRALEGKRDPAAPSPTKVNFGKDGAGSMTFTVSDVDSRPKTPEQVGTSSVASTSTVHAGSELQPVTVAPPSPEPSPRPATMELSPAKERKGRSPSMNMLQRATSVLAVGMRQTHKDREVTPEPPEPEKNGKRGDSPTKFGMQIKSTNRTPKMTKSESDPALLTIASGSARSLKTPEPTPSVRSHSYHSPPRESHLDLAGGSASADSTLERPKAPAKKDSLWTTFRHLFNEDKRRRKREDSPLESDEKPGKAVIPTRGARGPHMARSQMTSSRRTSSDGRGMYSHRSSTANSRRSSVSNPMGDYAINLHDGLNPTLNRRASGRSVQTGGSRTPNSEREHYSRPGSSQSRRGSSRRSSLRSPIHSDSASARFRVGPPASPLHNYHRRAASGGASTRVRHIKVIHEAKAYYRPSSVASSTRSNGSSRASSVDYGRGGDFDSDYDTGREDGSASNRSSRRRWSDERNNSITQLTQQARSPLGRQAIGRGRAPLRDVFQKKGTDDEWESEDESGAFVGGLGQGSTSTVPATSGAAYQTKWNTMSRPAPAQHPGGRDVGIQPAKPSSSRFPQTTGTRKGRKEDPESKDASASNSGPAAASSGASTGTSNGSGGSGGGSRSGRRGGLPSQRSQAPVIEEEEEEEEE